VRRFSSYDSEPPKAAASKSVLAVEASNAGYHEAVTHDSRNRLPPPKTFPTDAGVRAEARPALASSTWLIML
jgi:hypothetical protein